MQPNDLIWDPPHEDGVIPSFPILGLVPNFGTSMDDRSALETNQHRSGRKKPFQAVPRRKPPQANGVKENIHQIRGGNHGKDSRITSRASREADVVAKMPAFVGSTVASLEVQLRLDFELREYLPGGRDRYLGRLPQKLRPPAWPPFAQSHRVQHPVD